MQIVLRSCQAAAWALALVAVTGVACQAQPATADDRVLFTPAELSAIYRHSPLGPLPPDPTDRVADDAGAAALGQYLFFDTRFSASGKLSCSSCHNPSHGFADGRQIAIGMHLGTRNSPTVLNAAFGRWYFLDGRSDSLWSQALQPMENPKEMAGDRINIVRAVAEDPVLEAAYHRLFGALPDDVARLRKPAHAAKTPAAASWQELPQQDRRDIDRAFSNLGKVLEAYERRLISARAPFDRYLGALQAGDIAGQQLVISPDAKRGLKLFVGAARCELCHSGPAFTDGEFHNLGLSESTEAGRALGIQLVRSDPFNAAGPFSDAPDAHRDQLTFLPSPESQWGAFKTPSLRDIAITAPYMHDGRFGSLAQVVSFYTGNQRSPGTARQGRERTLDLIPQLSAAQQRDLVAFLHTLTGPPLPRALTTRPAHP